MTTSIDDFACIPAGTSEKLKERNILTMEQLLSCLQDRDAREMLRKYLGFDAARMEQMHRIARALCDEDPSDPTNTHSTSPGGALAPQQRPPSDMDLYVRDLVDAFTAIAKRRAEPDDPLIGTHLPLLEIDEWADGLREPTFLDDLLNGPWKEHYDQCANCKNTVAFYRMERTKYEDAHEDDRE